MRRMILPVCLFFLFLSAHAHVKNPGPGKLFDDTRVHTIEILIDTADLSAMNNDRESNEMHPATFVIHYADNSDTITNVGVRPKGNFSRDDTKISFKISFNTFKKGRKYKGIEKLNINAYMHEPTHLRAHLSAQFYAFAGLPAIRTAFADVYVNGDYYGLYNMVEHVDEEFTKSRFGSKDGNLYKCLLGANLTYQGPDVSKYDTLMDKRPKYELKTNEDAYDYSGLIELTDILTNTPLNELEVRLEQRFNVEDYIKCMAVEVLLGGWDGYLLWCNNYYLYDNPETGKFEFIPYDFDHTFGREILNQDMATKDIYNYPNYESFFFDPDTIPGITQGGIDTMNFIFGIFRRDTRRPLYDRLLQVEKYRNQYNYYLQYFMDNYFNSEMMNPEIDRLFAMLTPSLRADSSVRFTWEEIQQAIEGPLESGFSISHWHVKPFPYGLKDYVEVRTTTIKETIEPVMPLVTLNNVSERKVMDQIIVRVMLEGNPPEKVNLVVTKSDGKPRIEKMYDDGLHGDKKAGDGLYGCKLPATEVAGQNYYIRAELPDGEGCREPFTGSYTLPVVNYALSE